MDEIERRNYVPPTCRDCGAPTRVRWRDEKSMGDTDSDWVPVDRRCTNSECGNHLHPGA